jgi:hypothetical protein
MKKKVTLSFILASLVLISGTFTSCKKKEGCTDKTALNYDPDAEKDDGSCQYCTDCDTST